MTIAVMGTDLVDRLSHLLDVDREAITQGLWIGLALSGFYLLILLTTHWGGRHALIKALVFSLALHVFSTLGWVAIAPSIVEARNEALFDPESPEPFELTILSDDVSDVAHAGADDVWNEPLGPLVSAPTHFDPHADESFAIKQPNRQRSSIEPESMSPDLMVLPDVQPSDRPQARRIPNVPLADIAMPEIVSDEPLTPLSAPTTIAPNGTRPLTRSLPTRREPTDPNPPNRVGVVIPQEMTEVRDANHPLQARIDTPAALQGDLTKALTKTVATIIQSTPEPVQIANVKTPELPRQRIEIVSAPTINTNVAPQPREMVAGSSLRDFDPRGQFPKRESFDDPSKFLQKPVSTSASSNVPQVTVDAPLPLATAAATSDRANSTVRQPQRMQPQRAKRMDESVDRSPPNFASRLSTVRVPSLDPSSMQPIHPKPDIPIVIGYASVDLQRPTGPPTDRVAPVVSVRLGTDPGEIPSFLRLEYQLRIMAYYHNEGLTVARVIPGGPATRMTTIDSNPIPHRLKPGDLITHVDGRHITSQADYYVAMYLAGQRGGEVLIRVQDVNTGRFNNLRTIAERVGRARDSRIQKEAGPATRVKVILVGDTKHTQIGSAVSTNLLSMEGFVRSLSGFNPRDMVIFRDSNATASNVLQAIARMDVQNTDVLFCYVAGFGSYEKRLQQGDPSGGHYIQLDAKLMRKTLIGALEERGAQLTLLVSDTCNVLIPESLDDSRAAPVAVQSTAFEDLLMNSTGLIDINGSSRDQYGWYSSRRGGCFTNGFLFALRNWPHTEIATWDDFSQITENSVVRHYLDLKHRYLNSQGDGSQFDAGVRKFLNSQSDQRPQAFEFEVKRITEQN